MCGLCRTHRQSPELVEHEAFWSRVDDDPTAFFVVVPRAKDELLLTSAQVRPHPDGRSWWDSHRRAYPEFLSHAQGPGELIALTSPGHSS